MDVSQLSNYANQIFTWIGFGTVMGLIAIAVMPESDRGRNLSTLLMTIVGAMMACAILKYFYYDELVQPVSSHGFIVGFAGCLSLLVFFRVLGGFWIDDKSRSGFRVRVSRRQRKQAWIENNDS